jgi:GT2 family glycosyltransferase
MTATAGRVTVLIATYNRAPLLRECLAHLQSQSFQSGDEVIIVDNGSTDDTVDVVSRDQENFRVPLRLVHEPIAGKSRAIARGLSVASGDILAITDDDVNVDVGWLEAFRAALADGGVALVGGRVWPRFERTVPEWIRRAAEQYPRLGSPLAIIDYGATPIAIGPRTLPGGNMAIRRDVFEQVGGFPAHLGKLRGTLLSGEDHALCLGVQRAGFEAMYIPAATVYHWVPADRASSWYFLKWFFWSGITNAIIDAGAQPSGRTLYGMPLYLLRRAAVGFAAAVAALVTGRRTASLNRAVDVAFAAGYAAQRWRLVGRASPAPVTAAGESV